MKTIFGLVALLITGAWAATSALYLHHERSSQATVEADCQNREVCLDKVNLAPIGRFNDGTLWHGVTQEKPNVNLTGALTVTGATVLSNNLTLSLIPTGRIPYTTTAGLLTSGTGLTYNGSAFSVTGTGAFSGALSALRLNVNGATDAAGFAINSAGKGIAVSGGEALYAFGVGVPGDANFESVDIFSNGTNGILRYNKAGTGSYRNLLIQNGGSTALTIATNQAVTAANALASTGDFSVNTNKFNVTAATGNAASAGNYALAGRLNIGGATDANNYAINSAAGHIVASGTWGLQAYGVGTPGAANAEYIYINHNGATPFISVDKVGSGSYRGLEIKTGGATAITVATNQGVQLASTLGVTGVTTATGGLNLPTATVSTAAAFDGSKNLVSVTNTGTGNNVLSASPTFTGTINASSAIFGGTVQSIGSITASGGLNLGASFVDKTTSLTSNTTLTSAHSTIFASASGGSFTLTLPATAGNTGLTYTIYKTDVSAAATGGGNTVTIDGNASETIGGDLTQVLASNTGNGTLRIICDGSNWQVQQFYDEGSFILTLTGCTTSPTMTTTYARNGNSISMRFPGVTATSNTTSAKLTGAPAIFSSGGLNVNCPIIIDNTLKYPGVLWVNSGEFQLTFFNTISSVTSVGFTSSGTKGISDGHISYSLQ